MSDSILSKEFFIENNLQEMENIQEINDINKIYSEENSEEDISNINSILDFNESQNIKIENNLDLSIEQLSENFTSRDLVRLFLHMTKIRKNSEYEEFSMKGIKFWENLSKNNEYNLLFKKYKPWSLHTSYKRLFCHGSVDKIYDLINKYPNADLKFLSRIVNIKYKNEKSFGKKIKRKNNNNNVKNYYSNNKNINQKANINYDSSSDNESTHSENNVNNKYKQFSNFFNSQNFLPKNYSNLIKNVNKPCYENKIEQCDFLSDKLDSLNSKFRNKIQNSDYFKSKNYSYFTILNSQVSGSFEVRKFFSMTNFQNERKSLTLKIISNLKNETKYNEKFIIEALMRLSNDINDLKLFLSNPSNNIDLIWTELEDKIILNHDQQNSEENISLYNIILKLKGEARIKKRIKFLSEYIN